MKKKSTTRKRQTYSQVVRHTVTQLDVTNRQTGKQGHKQTYKQTVRQVTAESYSGADLLPLVNQLLRRGLQNETILLKND